MNDFKFLVALLGDPSLPAVLFFYCFLLLFVYKLNWSALDFGQCLVDHITGRLALYGCIYYAAKLTYCLVLNIRVAIR